MIIDIYYFSGTGNSLFIARNIAEKSNGRLIAISSLMDKDNISPEADIVGIVFPIYYATNDSGIPLIVSRFVKKLKNIDSKYVFAICTSGYTAGNTIENFDNLIRSNDGKLSAGFVINMSSKSLSSEIKNKIYKSLLNKSIEQIENDKHYREKQNLINNKLNMIAEAIKTRKSMKLETMGIIGKAFFGLYQLITKPIFLQRYRKLANEHSLQFQQLIPLADRSFKTNEKCNGCGICAKVCSVNNIEIVNGKPVWQHHCETCYACYQWCPNSAIYGEIVAYNDKYHHPEIKVNDMFKKIKNNN